MKRFTFWTFFGCLHLKIYTSVLEIASKLDHIFYPRVGTWKKTDGEKTHFFPSPMLNWEKKSQPKIAIHEYINSTNKNGHNKEFSQKPKPLRICWGKKPFYFSPK
jgi:hypothetical protein